MRASPGSSTGISTPSSGCASRRRRRWPRTSCAAIARGELRAGVWGADPGPGEGEPARLRGDVVSGVKTFCSGAGGLQRGLVLVRHDGAGPPLAAWLDLTQPGTVEIDRAWFPGAGMRSSASHRVVFDGAPVLAVLGEPGALTRAAVVRARRGADGGDVGGRRRRGGRGRARAPRRPAEHGRPRGAGRRSARDLAAGDRAVAGARGGGARRRAGGPARARTRPRTHGWRIADAARAILDEAERALGSRPRGDRSDARPRSPRPAAVPAPAPPRADPGAHRRRGAGGAAIDHLRGALPRRRRPVGDAHRPLRAREAASARSRRADRARSPPRCELGAGLGALAARARPSLRAAARARRRADRGRGGAPSGSRRLRTPRRASRSCRATCPPVSAST